MHLRLLLLTATASLAAQAPPVLQIACDRPLHAIPAALHGIALPATHATGEGGLHAELLQDRTFAQRPGADGVPPGWALELDTDAKATLTRDTDRPDDPASPQALCLRSERGAAAAVHAGSHGVALREHTSYALNLDLRRDATLPARLVASLTSAAGEVYTEIEVRGFGTTVTHYELRLQAPVTDPDARFAITIWGPGTLWLHRVSLCPLDTWLLRPDGLRQDLMERLRALRPGFVQFPLGPRPPGRALHDHLQLCEDLRADAVAVAEGTLDDVLAAIEYGNGAATSTWGSVRARHGRSEPFQLRHVALPDDRLRAALAASHPEIATVVVVTPPPGPAGLRGALAEAASWCDAERAGDPAMRIARRHLLAHAGDPDAATAAILFDGVRTCGTTRWLANVLFARHRAERLLPVTGSALDDATPAFTAVAGRIDATGEIVLKVVHAGERPRKVRLQLQGAGPLAPTAEGLVLSSRSLDDENSLDAPDTVVLRPFVLDGVGAGFDVEFAARSLTGLRLRPAK